MNENGSPEAPAPGFSAFWKKGTSMDVKDYMAKHGLDDETVEKMAARCVSDEAREKGVVHDGSHIAAQAKKQERSTLPEQQNARTSRG